MKRKRKEPNPLPMIGDDKKKKNDKIIEFNNILKVLENEENEEDKIFFLLKDIKGDVDKITILDCKPKLDGVKYHKFDLVVSFYGMYREGYKGSIDPSAHSGFELNENPDDFIGKNEDNDWLNVFLKFAENEKISKYDYAKEVVGLIRPGLTDEKINEMCESAVKNGKNKIGYFDPHYPGIYWVECFVVIKDLYIVYNEKLMK